MFFVLPQTSISPCTPHRWSPRAVLERLSVGFSWTRVTSLSGGTVSQTCWPKSPTLKWWVTCLSFQIWFKRMLFQMFISFFRGYFLSLISRVRAEVYLRTLSQKHYSVGYIWVPALTVKFIWNMWVKVEPQLSLWSIQTISISSKLLFLFYWANCAPMGLSITAGCNTAGIRTRTLRHSGAHSNVKGWGKVEEEYKMVWNSRLLRWCRGLANTLKKEEKATTRVQRKTMNVQFSTTREDLNRTSHYAQKCRL